MAQPGAWAAYCAQAEVPAEIQADLHAAVGDGTAVVLLLDDSGLVFAFNQCPLV